MQQQSTSLRTERPQQPRAGASTPHIIHHWSMVMQYLGTTICL